MIDNVLKFLFARALVRNAHIPVMTKYLRLILREKWGFNRADKIPDSVAVVIVNEAYHRAVKNERDGRARWGQYYKQIDLAAAYIVAAFRGEPNVDSRIREILAFNNLI